MTQTSAVAKRSGKLKSAVSAVILLGLGGAIAGGGMMASSPPVFADAVRVPAPQAPSFADVVEAVSPAVVSVRVEARVQPALDGELSPPRNLPRNPFRRFFDERDPFGDRFFRPNRPRRGERGPRSRRFGMSQGSGFFVSEDGYIVTNNHVVRSSSKLTVVLNDGEELEAELIGTDRRTDLAVLKVKADRKFTYVDFAKNKARVGDWVVAVGNPFGLGGTVTSGIVSAHSRDIGAGPYDNFIQIDAAVNKGNSGGPAFNLTGEVIGVNTAIFSPSGGNVGIAFAIPAATARNVVKALIEDGAVTRGWLGVRIQPVTKDIAESVGLDKDQGAIVSDPQPGGPASKAGIRSGDIITAVDGKNIKNPKQLARVIAAYSPSDKAAISVWRNGETREIEVELGKLPSNLTASRSRSDQGNQRSEPSSLEGFGLALEGSRDGVEVVDVEPGSEAAKKGIRVGDVVVSVNGRETPTPTEVEREISEALDADRKAILLQIRSGQNSRFVALPVSKG
ncbi:MAG: Do family serine endopeptidase [Pseudomonadota bacterium]